MKKSALTLSLILCALVLGRSQTSAQTITTVVGAGGGAAANHQTRLSATLGQAAIGLITALTTKGAQGFWYGRTAESASVAESAPGSSSVLTLSGAPNPLSGSTTLSFTVPQRDRVSLVLYNAIGQQVMTLINEERSPGTVLQQADLGALPAGSYTAVLRIGDRRASTTLLLTD